MNKIHKFYGKNYLSHKKESIFSFKKCGLYFETIFKENLLKIFKREPNLFNIESILDIGGGEGDKAFLLKTLINKDIKIDVLEISSERIKEGLKKFNNITFLKGDMLNYKFNKKYDLITFFTSLMFIKKEKDLSKLLKNINSNLNKEGYIIVYETLVKSHYNSKVINKNGYLGFNIKELDKLFLDNGFTKINTIKMYKKIAGKSIGYLADKIGIKNTICLDKIIPPLGNNYGNFITLYKKD